MSEAKCDTNTQVKKRRTTLAGFTVQKVLRHDTWNRQTALLGTFSADSSESSITNSVKSIVILKQDPFDASSIVPSDSIEVVHQTLLEILSAPDSLEIYKENDVFSYHKMSSNLDKTNIGNLTNISCEIIDPCSWPDIQKYMNKQKVTLIETPAMYEQLTLPYIASIPKKRTQWVFDILEGRAEQDCILCAADGVETGYVVVKSPHWKDGEHKNAFYLGLVRNSALKSIRDLRSCHLPLLRALLYDGLRSIESQHGLSSANVVVYFHYQPSFFHLHVHFRAIGAAADPNMQTVR